MTNWKSRLKICLLLSLTFLLMSCAATAPVGKAGFRKEALTDLRQQIDRFLEDSVLAQTRVGIKIISLESGETWYERNSQELFHPASNLKLLTTATALKRLGPDFRFKTVLFTDSTARIDSVLRGNLYLKGYGDPELTSDDLRHMIENLKLRGVQRISGNLIYDDSYFDDLYWGEGWMWDDTSSPDFAPISSLSVNDNCVVVRVHPGRKIGDSLRVEIIPATSYMKIENHGLTVAPSDTLRLQEFKVERQWKIPQNTIVVKGGLAINSPPQEFEIEVFGAAQYTATLFRELLQQAGLILEGGIHEGMVPENARILVEHLSPPLALVVFNTNKISDNLSAEMVLKTLGAELKGLPGTARKGTAVIREYLSALGVDSSRYEIVDGSGVSRYNLVTPSLLTPLLQDMYFDFSVQAEFMASLPIAGVDGTLKKRMGGTAAANKLRAKTGTLRGVSTLSGYTETADGEVVAFSMMMEHFLVKAKEVRKVQDRIGALLSSFSRKNATALRSQVSNKFQ